MLRFACLSMAVEAAKHSEYDPIEHAEDFYAFLTRGAEIPDPERVRPDTEQISGVVLFPHKKTA